ncbi:MAG: insulinase family protein [Gemmatimonadales bacterium]|nr:insulinase family protein [Gemmatimonadales bacterium]NIS66437.1 insulinase family protein [Gemmatimonadales bacterium]
MKRLALIPACLMALAACEMAPEGTITVREPDSPFIAFNVWVKAGSQNDPAGKEGLAALTANLLSDGSTTEDSYDAILAKLYPMAAGYGYSVDKEMTAFRGRVHKDNLEAYYTLFRNALLNPAFSEEDFERVKTQTLNFLERTRRYGRDEELSKELLFWMAYRGTPYEHPEEGYVQSVRSITLDDVKAFYQQFYVRNNIVVGVAGGYPGGFVQRVRIDFDALPEAEVVPAPAPEAAMPDGIKVLIVEKQTSATAISFGHPISLVRGDDDFFAMMAANSWFGEHRNSFSHLYQVIRESRGMNYGDYSYIEAFPRGYTTQQPPINSARRHHLFEIWIRPISLTAPGNLHERALFATRAAWRELKALVDGGMTDETLEATQEFLHNFTLNYAPTVSRRLAYAVDDAFYGIGGDGFLSSLRPGLAGLTLDQVSAAIKRHLQYENMWVVFITDDAQGMKQKLLTGVPTAITYAGEKSAEHMAEDELIASFPIPVDEEDITIMGINDVFERSGG